MNEKIRLKQAVIVEGKYDKIRLESVVDALILTTGGFRIYNNREQRELIRSLAKTRGIVVLTDSDRAGFRIRGHLSGMIPEGEITHVFIPDLKGKERRKHRPSAEGKLGVEGVDADTLREAFRRAGVIPDESREAGEPITRMDLYQDGFTGGWNSAEKRRELYRRLGLPQGLSTANALPLLNHMLTRQEYRALARELEQE